MIEDKLLIWRFNQGRRDALAAIYRQYLGHLITIAAALTGDVNTAEDIVHDFFVSFAATPPKLKLNGHLKAYLTTCVVNRVRDRYRSKTPEPVALCQTNTPCAHTTEPLTAALENEKSNHLCRALNQLPQDQREVIVLHLRGRLKFRRIAQLQNVSINTIQSRYRYALDKLRSLL